MVSIQALINEIIDTGAKFVVTDDGIGLSKLVPESLLVLAKLHKKEIVDYLQQQDTQQGLMILKQLSAGLPIDGDELMAFYADDLQYIGTGEIPADTIKCSIMKLTEGRPPAEVDERVRCTECTQYRCRRKGRQYSPVLRWCNQYHAE